jgi:hypothetical protein
MRRIVKILTETVISASMKVHVHQNVFEKFDFQPF